MDPIWIIIAFICGFLAKQISLPPLIGYLVAGFGLHYLGFQPEASLQTLADLGITLLLFTIGLKLSVKNLIKTEVWATSFSHTAIMVTASLAMVLALSMFGLPYFADLTLKSSALIGFAISFSSTVVVFKILEDNNELKSRHGQIAIGVLVLQDIIAIIFLAITAGKVPTLWATALLLLPFLRPYLSKILNACGHGEVLPLAGFVLAFGGSELFELVGIKGDLGALIFGIMLSHHKKATELSRTLLHFKDIFLIGFFLSIGFTALPTLDMLSAASLVTFALLFKFVLFFLLLTGFKIRGRSSFLASLNLTNFSEFGLIVMTYSIANNMIPEDWIVIMALAVSLSFLISTVINRNAHKIYMNWKHHILRFERTARLKEDVFKQPKGATILIIGMGRVGTGAYKQACEQKDATVWGVDIDAEKVQQQHLNGLNVIRGDAEDYDFWHHIELNKIELIMLATPALTDMMEIIQKLHLCGYAGKLACITKYEDDRRKVLAAGADVAFNVYAEAGVGFADETFKYLNKK